MAPEQIAVLVIGLIVAVVVIRAAVGCLVRLVVIVAVLAALAYVFLR